MRPKRNYWLLLLVFLSAFIYGSAWVPPSKLAIISILNFGIPLILGFNLLLFFIFLISCRRWLIYPLSSLVLGVGFLKESIAFNASNTSGESITILSYNVKMFRKPGGYHIFSTDLINHAIADSSDIKCFQEFSTNARWKELDVIGMMSASGYNSHAIKGKMDDLTQSRGMAIFSKLPIVHRGVVWESPGTTNACIFVDVLLKKDTIRIYNAHLESMNLKLHRMKDPDHYNRKLKGVLSSLMEGAKKREHQISLTLDHCVKSPYPYIIAGDMNEIPYSYNYRRLRNQMSSSFQEAGHGFGFSYNSPLFFLRIDHHFHGSRWKVSNFKTDRSIKLSDHFPTHADYSLNRDEP